MFMETTYALGRAWKSTGSTAVLDWAMVIGTRLSHCMSGAQVDGQRYEGEVVCDDSETEGIFS